MNVNVNSSQPSVSSFAVSSASLSTYSSRPLRFTWYSGGCARYTWPRSMRGRIWR